MNYADLESAVPFLPGTLSPTAGVNTPTSPKAAGTGLDAQDLNFT